MIAGGEAIALTLASDTGDETSVTGVGLSDGGTSTETADGTDVYRNFMYSALATEVNWDKSADQYNVELTYHGDESYVNLYVNAPTTTVSGGGVAGIPILTDSAAASSTANLIVVGGSCINSIAAELLGGAKCEADFTAATNVAAGQYIIATYARGGKLATLVAGYNAVDTTAAALALVNDKPAITAGAKVVGP